MEEQVGSTILARAKAAYEQVLADPVGGRSLAAKVLHDARSAGSPEALVVALRAAAWSSRHTPQAREGLRMLDQAVRLATSHILPERLAQVLMSRSSILTEFGRFTAARRDLISARRCIAPSDRAELALKQATLLTNVGRTDEAVRLLKLVLQDPTAGPDERVKANNNLGYNEAQQGQYQAALEHVAAAVREAPASGIFMRAVATQTSAWVNVEAGRLRTGIALFEAAAALHELAGLPLGEHYIEYADALTDLRLLPEALTAARRAVEELADTPLMQAEAELRVARLLLLSGQPDTARTAATRAAVLLRRQGRTGWVARAAALAHAAQLELGGLSPQQARSLRGCARTLEEHGMVADAVDAYLTLGRTTTPHRLQDLAHAQRLARRGAVLTRLKGRVAAALAAETAGDARQVLRHCRAGLDDLALHRDALPSTELRILASGHGVELGSLGLRALLPTGRADRVLLWMERTRAAVVIASRLSLDHASPPAELGDLLREKQSAADAALLAGEGVPPALADEIAGLEDRIRRQEWHSDARPAVHSRLSVGRLRTLLGDATLVEYALLEGVLHAVVIEPGGNRLVELGPLGGLEGDVDALLFALRRMARPGAPSRSLAAARQNADALLQRLSDRLVAPLALDGEAPLVVVPVGPLQRVPWSPLHAAPVTVVPSAAVWASTAGTSARPPGPVALVAGPGLPGAVAEVLALQSTHQGATSLAPPDSTARATVQALAGADLAHLACHGRVRADNPLFSALVLADGQLTVHEIASRSSMPRQVVLAACDSAVQTTYAGEESMGFVTALLSRGTEGLLASTVVLPDLDTIPLVRSLHETLAGGTSMADALHSARSSLDLGQPGAYVAWCAFQAYGAG